MINNIQIGSTEHTNYIAKAKKYLKDTDTYKQINNLKYKTPNNYTDWSFVSLCLTYYIEYYKRNSVNHSSVDDAISDLIGILGNEVLSNIDYPVYWIKKDLLDALYNTNVLEDLVNEDIANVISAGFIMLPKGYLYDENGFPITWLCVRFSTLSKNPVLFVATVSEALITKFTGTLVFPISKDIISEINNNDFNDNNTYLKSKILRIIVNLLLVMKTKPEFISNNNVNNNIGFGKQQKGSKNNPLNPIWIGKDFVIKHDRKNVDKIEFNNEDKHKVKSHWVRGHWRRVVTGKRELNQRVLTWINPYIVLGETNDCNNC